MAVFAVTLAGGCLAGRPDASAQNEVTVQNFYQFPAKANPSPLIAGSDGNLYGTDAQGGPDHNGIFFQLSPAGKLTILHTFASTEGTGPQVPLFVGSDGNFYGATSGGGANNAGTLFRLTASGTLTVLHNFAPASNEGSHPSALVQGDDGSFYGTASGGANSTGLVFKFTPGGALTTLYSFSAPDDNFESDTGFGPTGPLVKTADGNFLGTTRYGGIGSGGTLYRVTPTGTYSTVIPLGSSGVDDPSISPTPPHPGGDGNFYFTTVFDYDDFYDGIVGVNSVGQYIGSASLSGSSRVYPPVVGADGKLYGATAGGGPNGDPAIYTLTPSFDVEFIYDFAPMPNGGTLLYPTTPLVLGVDGFLYGVVTFNGTVLRFAPSPPVITSPVSVSVQIGNALSYQIAATGNPTGYAAKSLPAGLSVDPSTGKITGTPTAAGTFSVVIEASNFIGTGQATLAITVAQPPPPVITGNLTPPSRQGVIFAYQITATNNPTSFATLGLPAGLGLSKSTGKISGTPTKAGTYSVSVKATNGGGTGSATLNLVVKEAAPVITGSLNPPSRQGVSFGYQITATNNPTSYGEAGLPAGLTINQSTGRISGTPKISGTFAVTIKATNGGGSGTATLNLVVKQAAPVITSSLNPPSRQGVSFTYQITATNEPAGYSATGLPTGLTINQNAGKITGKPAKAGTYNVTIKATNSGGSGTARLSLVVKPAS